MFMRMCFLFIQFLLVHWYIAGGNVKQHSNSEKQFVRLLK